MASASTLHPPLDDLFSSSTLSTTSAAHSTHAYRQHPSPLSHAAPHPLTNPPTYSLSPHAASSSSASAALSPAALHSLLTTKQKELSDLATLQSSALSTHLASLTSAYQTLRASYGALKADFLYNLGLLNERDAELAQWEADDTARHRRDEERERECVALRSEARVRAAREKERAEEERLRRAELAAGYETKLAVVSEELGKLRVAVEDERVKGDRRVEEVREEAERERREVQRTYEARLAEEQRARMELKEALDETIDLTSRDKRRAEDAALAAAAEVHEQQRQLSEVQADRKEADRLCRQLKQQLHDSQEQLSAAQMQLSEVHDSSDTRLEQLRRERDEAVEECRAAEAHAEEERAQREQDRAEDVERRRAALAIERQRDEERTTDWRRRLEEKTEEAEAERRERRKVEYEAVMVKLQAEAEREVLEARVEELQREGERKEQEWKRELWRLTEELKDRRDRTERLQREKEQRREELIRLKATVDELKAHEEEWNHGVADAQRRTAEAEEERTRSQELEEEVVRLRAELQRVQDVGSAQPSYAVHVTDEHGRQQQRHRHHLPHRPSSISTAAHSHPPPPQQRHGDYSPAFSDDLGPVSLPSSETNSPRAAPTHEQLQAENESLRVAIDTMRGEMHRVVSEVEARDALDGREVERLRSECQRAERERQEWRAERERLLDISNRLKAELRHQRTAPAAAPYEEKEQPSEAALDAAAGWKVSEGQRRSGTVGDIDRVRQALNGLIHSNQQLSDNIKLLSAAPHTSQRQAPLPHSDFYPHILPQPQPLPPAPATSYTASPRAQPPVPTTQPASIIPAPSALVHADVVASSAKAPTTSPAARRAAHRRSSGLRHLHTAELALSSASALSAEVERLSPRSDEHSPRTASPTTAAPAQHSPSRTRLQLSGRRAALLQRDNSGDAREVAAGGQASSAGVSSRQAVGAVKKDKAVLSGVKSRVNLLGKVRNYAAGS